MLFRSATLEEVREADVLLHVIDASSSGWEEQRLVVDEVLGELGVHDRPLLHVFNKVDRMAPADLAALRERMANLLPGSVFVSAVAAGGTQELQAELRARLDASRPLLRLRIPAAAGKLLAEVHREADVVETTSDPETGDSLLAVRADDALRGRLERAGVVAS